MLWSLLDHLSTVRDLVYHNGSAVILAQHNELDAFGALLSAPTVETLALYTGRFFDMVTALQYNRARWYDASVGRWMSTDPIGFAAADANLYRYVGNGVLWQADPEGMLTIGWEDFWNRAERRRGHGPWGSSAQHCWAACYLTAMCGDILGLAAALLEDYAELESQSSDWIRDMLANHAGVLAGSGIRTSFGGAANICEPIVARQCDGACLTWP